LVCSSRDDLQAALVMQLSGMIANKTSVDGGRGGVVAEDFQTNADGKVTPGTSGWAMYNYPKNQPEDHCTSLCGYGTLAELVALFQQHKVTVHPPKGMPTGLCYAMFTWNSIGIIDQQSMLNMTYEAWIRSPATIVKVTLPDTSPKSPALASLNGFLHLGWKGDGNDNLNVMCSADGITFGPSTSLRRPVRKRLRCAPTTVSSSLPGRATATTI